MAGKKKGNEKKKQEKRAEEKWVELPKEHPNDPRVMQNERGDYRVIPKTQELREKSFSAPDFTREQMNKQYQRMKEVAWEEDWPTNAAGVPLTESQYYWDMVHKSVGCWRGIKGVFPELRGEPKEAGDPPLEEAEQIMERHVAHLLVIEQRPENVIDHNTPSTSGPVPSFQQSQTDSPPTDQPPSSSEVKEPSKKRQRKE